MGLILSCGIVQEVHLVASKLMLEVKERIWLTRLTRNGQRAKLMSYNCLVGNVATAGTTM